MKSTEIIFVIDASGSMAHLVGDTIGGFNGFIESQKAIEGKATLTTVLFDSTWKILHDGVDIHEVKPMTKSDYVAGGMTAMLDAIGDIINKVQDRHDELGVEKPEEVLFVITTDGEENSSHKFTKAQIEKMIKHQTNGHGWKFMFLGANMDAVKEARDIGISSNYATNYTYTAQGTSGVFATMDCVTKSVRGCVDALVGEIGDEFVLSSAYAACSNDIDAAIKTSVDADTISDLSCKIATLD
jgi:uncharacterized protein YegL